MASTRSASGIALSLLLGLAAGDAQALTAPMTGATLFPSGGEALRLPFPAGARVRVTSGYGPSAGSSLHRNLVATGFGNDYYALDLVYEGEPDGGRGLPIVAALSGTVVRAGWATEGWANFGQRVILRHDLSDGRVYHSLYAHLHAIDPAIVAGASVAQGAALGELGGSCQGMLSCGSFTQPHLHFSVHRDSMVGGSGTGGSYGGNAVVPEPIDGHEDLMRGQVIESFNAPGPPVCGDGACVGGETPATCPADCPVCRSVPAAGRTVDETEPCFARGGDPQYWRVESDGYDGSLLWTHATDGPVDNYGVWELMFDEAGRYLVEAYTDADWAQAQQAMYFIQAGESAPARVRLDQSASDGWRSLGEHDFVAVGVQTIRLDDNTGEPFALRRQLVFDAIRLTRVGSPSLDGGALEDAGGAPDGGARDGGARDGGVRADGGADTGVGPDRPGSVDGCGCRAVAPAPNRAAWLCLLGLALAATRRRR